MLEHVIIDIFEYSFMGYSNTYKYLSNIKLTEQNIKHTLS